MAFGSDLYIRKWGVVVSNDAGDGIDVSDLRCVFATEQASVDPFSPNTLALRIFNLSEKTASRIYKEFTHVALQAGYEGGNFGVIFEGTIKQIKKGRTPDMIETYLDVFAGDGDRAYNFAIINKALAAGATPTEQIKAIQQAMLPYGMTENKDLMIPLSAGTGGTLPRGKVMFGMGRDRATNLANSHGVSWSIQNGKLTIVEDTGYLEDEVLVLNAATGLIGVPQVTNNGVEARILLNPNVKIGTRVQIDNAAINQERTVELGQRSLIFGNPFPATVTADGIYRVLVAEHQGDTRGTQWYTNLTCLAVDPSTLPSESVKAYG